MDRQGRTARGGGGEGGDGGDGGDGGEGGGGVDTAEVIQHLESEEVRKHIRKQFSKKKKALGELKGKFKQNADANDQRPSLSTPKKIFDWKNVNFGFLHYKVIKKMFSSLTVDYTTGKSGNN